LGLKKLLACSPTREGEEGREKMGEGVEEEGREKKKSQGADVVMGVNVVVVEEKEEEKEEEKVGEEAEGEDGGEGEDVMAE
jgi:hypothetical protein